MGDAEDRRACRAVASSCRQPWRCPRRVQELDGHGVPTTISRYTMSSEWRQGRFSDRPNHIRRLPSAPEQDVHLRNMADHVAQLSHTSLAQISRTHHHLPSSDETPLPPSLFISGPSCRPEFVSDVSEGLQHLSGRQSISVSTTAAMVWPRNNEPDRPDHPRAPEPTARPPSQPYFPSPFSHTYGRRNLQDVENDTLVEEATLRPGSGRYAPRADAPHVQPATPPSPSGACSASS